MPTYDEFRKVGRKLGFQLIRSEKHETWRKIDENGNVLEFRISHKHSKDIPKGTLRVMLRQAGIKSEREFRQILKNL